MTGKSRFIRSWLRRAAYAAVFALVADGLQAQIPDDLSLARTFGAGVHAYFSGDFARSYDDLTAAIEAGSEDPRTRYFRGLSALRLGRLDEAEADFSEGSELEARALGGWPVSRSLERVQGHDRLRLERHRVRARVAALQRDRAAAADRYSGIEDAQPEVLRRRRPAAPRSPTGDAANPFSDQPEPVTPAQPSGDDPEPMPEPETATVGDAASAAQPADVESGPEAAADANAEAPAEDPFGAPAEPEAGVPFGSPQ